jgi:hypothetical protein
MTAQRPGSEGDAVDGGIEERAVAEPGRHLGVRQIIASPVVE